MKVFWSWQSDTPGKIGRHFIRLALEEAINVLTQPKSIEEPLERERREKLTLDHDRKGIPGSPDLAALIFKKIEQATVFVADVTLVSQSPQHQDKISARKFINPNVAIEYGYALKALSSENVLMVQNTHYGAREELPFDLRHKAGPILYTLSPAATRQEIDQERRKLRRELVDALKPYLTSPAVPSINETMHTKNIAFYWQPSECIASCGTRRSQSWTGREADLIEYQFDEPTAFFIRLIPMNPAKSRYELTELLGIVKESRLAILTRTSSGCGGISARNQYGVITFEPRGSSRIPLGFSQIFRNGEIWGVSADFIGQWEGERVIPMVNIKNIYSTTLENYMKIATNDLLMVPPFTIELGAVGLTGMVVSLPNTSRMLMPGVSEPIHEDQCQIRRLLNNVTDKSYLHIVEEFVHELYDLVGIAV